MKKHVYPLEPGNFYHVFNRGIDGCKIFFDENNYSYFLKLFEKKILPIADLYCYCLLPNHFHFLVKIKSAKEIREALSQKENIGVSNIISKQFSNFFNSYSQAINKRFSRTGKLFEQPFRRIFIESNEQLKRTVFYVHNNPRKHQLHDDIFEYPYSSLQKIINKNSEIIISERVIDIFGGLEIFNEIHNA